MKHSHRPNDNTGALLLASAGTLFVNYGVAQYANTNKLTSLVGQGQECLQVYGSLRRHNVTPLPRQKQDSSNFC